MNSDTPKQHGFTVIELLTVISITVVLIGIMVPTFARVRIYARQLVSARNQRDIVTAVTLFACDHNQQFPPSVALCERPDGSWRWQDPRKVHTTRPRRKMEHNAVAGYLAGYLEDAGRMLCPNIPQPNPYWHQAWRAADQWDHPRTDYIGDPMFGSYCLYWNYLGLLDGGVFRGPINLYGGPGQSELLVSDYFGYNESRNRSRYGSCEMAANASPVDANSIDSSYWSFSALPERMRLNAGYTDGHVERIAASKLLPMKVSETSDGRQPYWEFDPRYPGLFYLPEQACSTDPWASGYP
jgi:prepilin-type N-terminal cleavage/methylation domain-containing protein